VFEHQLGLTFEENLWGPTELLGHRRWGVALPHPNSRGNKWGLEHYIRSETLLAIRGELASDDQEIAADRGRR
jgi:hypothetical protein